MKVLKSAISSPNNNHAVIINPNAIIIIEQQKFKISLIDIANVSNRAPKLGNWVIKILKNLIEISTVVNEATIVKLSVVLA